MIFVFINKVTLLIVVSTMETNHTIMEMWQLVSVDQINHKHISHQRELLWFKWQIEILFYFMFLFFQFFIRFSQHHSIQSISFQHNQTEEQCKTYQQTEIIETSITPYETNKSEIAPFVSQFSNLHYSFKQSQITTEMMNEEMKWNKREDWLSLIFDDVLFDSTNDNLFSWQYEYVVMLLTCLFPSIHLIHFPLTYSAWSNSTFRCFNPQITIISFQQNNQLK